MTPLRFSPTRNCRIPSICHNDAKESNHLVHFLLKKSMQVPKIRKLQGNSWLMNLVNIWILLPFTILVHELNVTNWRLPRISEASVLSVFFSRLQLVLENPAYESALDAYKSIIQQTQEGVKFIYHLICYVAGITWRDCTDPTVILEMNGWMAVDLH